MTQVTDPPVAGDEASTLRGFLDFQRDVLRRKTEGLSADQLGRTLPGHPSTMTLGGLLKHTALVELDWLVGAFEGQPIGEPWQSADWDADPDWEFHSAADDTPEHLRGLFDAAVARADAVIDAAVARPDGLDALAVHEGRHGRVSLRWILTHLIEEEARHLGHADLLREAIDGAVGD
ncbi:DinB family protein [Micropruina sp.]|uniref:DinB family protein n=1 Tax=Micropruina sp. TaxID=2737536 RepID=UPI0039E515C2